MADLIRSKDPGKLRPGIDPAWWCVPIVVALALGLLNLIFEQDSRTVEQRFSAPAPQVPDGRPEKPDPYAELEQELKKEKELKKDAAVTQPTETLSPYEAAVRQFQKGK